MNGNSLFSATRGIKGSRTNLDGVELSPDAVRLLQRLFRGDATRSENRLLQLPTQSQVLSALLANRLIEWKSHHVRAITTAGEKCFQRGGDVR